MHHSIYADSTNTLHRLGEKLSDAVSPSISISLLNHLFSRVIRLTRDRQLFGEDEDSTDELDEAEKQGENGELSYAHSPSFNPLLLWILTRRSMLLLAQEIENLRREAQAFKSVRAALRSKDSSSNAAKMVFQKVRFFYIRCGMAILCPTLRYSTMIFLTSSPWKICGDSETNQYH
jgi:hypothetical protein